MPADTGGRAVIHLPELVRREEVIIKLITNTMLNKIINLLRGPRYVCTPLEYLEGAGACVVVRAWSRNSARIKAYDYLQAENIVAKKI